MSEYGFCPMNDNHDGRQKALRDIPFSLQALCEAICLSPTVLVYTLFPNENFTCPKELRLALTLLIPCIKSLKTV